MKKFYNWVNLMKYYYSNCLFEFIKFKLKNKKIKMLYVPSFLNEVRCFHIMWSDGENEYDFNYNGYLPFYKWIWHKGYIRKLKKGTYSKYLCNKIKYKYE